MKQAFENLIHRFCELYGPDDPERVIQGGPVTVSQVVFSLIYSEAVDPQLLFVYSDYGEVPRGRKLEIYRALLQANLHLYTGRGPILALSTDGLRVVRADHCRLAGLQPQALHAMLTGLAASAKAWRGDPLARKAIAGTGADMVPLERRSE
jgi:hypothetical protein